MFGQKRVVDEVAGRRRLQPFQGQLGLTEEGATLPEKERRRLVSGFPFPFLGSDQLEGFLSVPEKGMLQSTPSMRSSMRWTVAPSVRGFMTVILSHRRPATSAWLRRTSPSLMSC